MHIIYIIINNPKTKYYTTYEHHGSQREDMLRGYYAYKQDMT